MTGADFAKAHGNDSTDWTIADFESLEVLAEIDAYTSPDPQPTPLQTAT